MFVAAVTEANQAAIGTQNPQRSEMPGSKQNVETRLTYLRVLHHVDSVPATIMSRLLFGHHVIVWICLYVV